ncbi:MAG TPA: DEAD/DEAH box helicase [Pseudonocardiaceae bacterium]|nr:DEAD/DEAH box helicase [Pseudonocardiaceae bacterium]
MIAAQYAPDIAAGAQVEIRDEEWLVRSVRRTQRHGLRLEVTGASELVRDQDAVFFTDLDAVTVLDPRRTRLVADDTPSFRRSRLWLESLLRQSPTPSSDTRVVAGHRGLLDRMDYQLRPAEVALSNLRPRILIGDAVGLGKTLEIGVLLTELIQRGRGERILVVTPRAVLEQFQHELWTRFAIPLVRLDSEGLQKVRQTLPASRNPFSYYRRVIVSIDTVKNPARYRHYLDTHRWDVVVIDECHNLINRGTQNNALARVLARQTEALILASATPHNGKPESFAELVTLLDPASIANPSDYSSRDIEHLYVRRHRNSPDVKLEVAHRWAPRREPRIVPVRPTGEEEAVLDELRRVWLHPPGGSVVRERGRALLPWTLFKAFLSSPEALRVSIRRRRDTLRRQGDLGRQGDQASPEAAALARLDELNEAARRRGPAKLDALVAHLHEIGVGRGSEIRVVVFSERIDTLLWLRDELRRRTGLPGKAVELLHAQLPDKEVQRVVEGFALAGAPVRVLLASDMASEGINLHRQCHQLVHYDLPWSFIRIQQRNGRIDRYLQLREPQITALALTSADPETDSDLRVVTKLLAKEHAANQALGDAGVLLNLHDEEIEERTVMAALQQGQDLDEVVPAPEAASLNPFAALMTIGGAHQQKAPVATAPRRTLFDDADNFLIEALDEIAADLHLTREEDTDFLAFDTPADLTARLANLPESYLAERQVNQRIRLTGQQHYAEQRLAKARQDGDTLWPDVHFLAPVHPVLDWAASRVLALFGRNEAPVVAGAVDAPVFCTQAVWSNALGQPALARWSAISGPPQRAEITDLVDILERAGLKERSVNPGSAAAWLAELQPLVPAAIEAATDDLRRRRHELETELLAWLDAQRAKLGRWEQQALWVAERDRDPGRRKSRIVEVRDETSRLIDSLVAHGEPFVRVVAVIVPARPGRRG